MCLGIRGYGGVGKCWVSFLGIDFCFWVRVMMGNREFVLRVCVLRF